MFGHERLNVWYKVTFQAVRQDIVLINFDKCFDMCLHIRARRCWLWWLSCQVMSDSFQLHGLYSPTGPSVLGISQARTLEGVAISSSRGSSRPRDQTYISCIVGRFFPEPLGKPQDQEEDDPVQTITRRKGISQELITDLNFDVQIDFF